MAEAPSSESQFRYDIQGLRAIAVLLVAFGHANLLHLTGGYIGVDVFFVISGYLITQWLLREKSRTGRIAYRRFYAARARRILPAAVLTLLVTDLACIIVLNPIQAQSVLHDSIWAVFFAANIHFAHIATDYFASALPPSPLQHFWSLSVEEQFYLVWPAILLFVAYPIRKPRVRRRNKQFGEPVSQWSQLKTQREKRVALTIIVVVVLSFAWSVTTTSSNPAGAYFSTLARVWELGVGALLVIADTQIRRLPVSVRSAATWLGFAAIMVAAFTYTSHTAIPGSAAAVPVLGAALIIAGGIGPTKGAVGVVLGRQPFVYIGDVSYAFYLWHWPALIITEEYVGHSLSGTTNLLLLILAFVISVVTYTFFENPIRRSEVFKVYRWAFLGLWGASLGSVILMTFYGDTALSSALAAREIGSSVVKSVAPVKPVKTDIRSSGTTTTAPVDPAIAAVVASAKPAVLAQPIPGGLSPPYQDLAADSADLGSCLALLTSVTSDICHDGDSSAGRTLVVFGNSHAEMWMTPLSNYAKSRGWKLVPLIKQSCFPSDETAGATDSCAEWYAWAQRELAQLKPQAIVLSQEWAQGLRYGAPTSVHAYETEIATLQDYSPTVIVFEDTPYLNSNPTDCLLANGAHLGSCVGSDYTLLRTDSELKSGALSQHFDLLSTDQWFCSADHVCPAVIGRTIAYRNQFHISNTYASQLSGPLATALDQFLVR